MDDFFSSINGRMCRLGGIEWEPSNSSNILALDVRQLFPRHIIVISIVPPVRDESKAKELTYPHLVFSWPHVTCAYWILKIDVFESDNQIQMTDAFGIK